MGFHYPPVPGRCHNRIQALIFTRHPRACACARSSHVGPKPITRQFPASPLVPTSFFCPPSHQLEGEGQLGFLLAGSAPWDPLQRGPNEAFGDRNNPAVPLRTAATSPAVFLGARRVAHTHAQPPLSHRGSPARAELFSATCEDFPGPTDTYQGWLTPLESPSSRQRIVTLGSPNQKPGVPTPTAGRAPRSPGSPFPSHHPNHLTHFLSLIKCTPHLSA